VIRFTRYGVITEKLRVSHLGHFFVHPVGKTMHFRQFFDGLDVFYHHANFGEDSTTRAGSRFENPRFYHKSLLFEKD